MVDNKAIKKYSNKIDDNEIINKIKDIKKENIKENEEDSNDIDVLDMDNNKIKSNKKVDIKTIKKDTNKINDK